MAANCPLIGKPCETHGCEFWDLIPASTEDGRTPEFACRSDINNRMQNDIARHLSILLASSEHHRGTFTKMVQANYTGKPSESLLKDLGLKQNGAGQIAAG